jgi:hypothetical protein
MQPGVASMATAPSSTLATVDIEGLLLLSTCKHHIASFTIPRNIICNLWSVGKISFTDEL